MRKVLVYWNIILIVLITGTVAVVYSKILLKREIAQAERIKKEMPAPKIRSKFASTDIEAPLEAEAYKTPEEIGLPEIPEVTANQIGPVPPHTHGLPTMPRFYKPLGDLNN